MNRVAALLATFAVLAMSVGLLLGTGSSLPQAVVLGSAGTCVLAATAAKERAAFESMCRASARNVFVGVVVIAVVLLLLLSVDGAIAGANPFNPDDWSRLVAKSGAFGFIATAFVAYSSFAALLAMLVYRGSNWLYALLFPSERNGTPPSEA